MIVARLRAGFGNPHTNAQIQSDGAVISRLPPRWYGKDNSRIKSLGHFHGGRAVSRASFVRCEDLGVDERMAEVAPRRAKSPSAARAGEWERWLACWLW